jgi:hypothetical protein
LWSTNIRHGLQPASIYNLNANIAKICSCWVSSCLVT